MVKNDTNLYEDTMRVIKELNHTVEDIKYVICDGKLVVWYYFEDKAKNFNYNNSYGTAEVNTTLVIVFDDCIMFRGEYDGTEWWDVKHLKPTIDGIYKGEFKDYEEYNERIANVHLTNYLLYNSNLL